MKSVTWLFFLLLFFSQPVFSQDGEERYVPETDPMVLEKLEQWQDLIEYQEDAVISSLQMGFAGSA